MKGSGARLIDGLDARTVAAAVSEALAEHEAWLREWQRAMACDLPLDRAMLDDTAHRSCRFGEWLERNDSGPVLGKLRAVHRELHESARSAARSRTANAPLGRAEYDAVLAATDTFRATARGILEACGIRQDEALPDSNLDELQGRLTMLGELERERDRALRTGAAMALMMVRTEGMDELERTHGRPGLDRVVAGIATRLFGLLRPYDGIFRHGMNDFVVCLPGTNADQAAGIARRLIEVIRSASVKLPDDTEIPLRAGFGVAAIDPRRPVQETLEHAARAAGMAGARGGEPVVVWTPEREN